MDKTEKEFLSFRRIFRTIL